jgi:tRNA(Ile)-lysidine synthase TilS/MesJ
VAGFLASQPLSLLQPEPENSGFVIMNLDTVQQINETHNGEPIIVMFSTGKDSIVMADLLIKGYRGHKEFVFLYFVPGLAIKQRIIEYYENRWNITVRQQPHFPSLSREKETA